MSKKSIGSNAERHIIDLFWENGWAALRAAGSGSTKHPCPDILAGNSVRQIVIECKVSGNKKKYFEKREIEELEFFAKLVGAEPWVAIKFSRVGWFFLPTSELVTTNTSLAADVDISKNKGYTFFEMIGKEK